jgi:hypothetical protein
MGVAIGLAVPLKLKFGYYVNLILWSLVCEEIYYFIYPALLRLRDVRLVDTYDARMSYLLSYGSK